MGQVALASMGTFQCFIRRTSSRFCSRVIWLAFVAGSMPQRATMTGCILAGSSLTSAPWAAWLASRAKIPGDAVIELFLAQGGLQVDLGVVLVLFMSPRWLDALRVSGPLMPKWVNSISPCSSKMSLPSSKGSGSHFSGQAPSSFAVRVMADQTDQTGHRLHKGVPGLPGQPVAVTGGAGGGIAHTAGGHQHGIGPVFFPGSPRTPTHRRAGPAFSFWDGADFPARQGGFRLRGQLFQKQLFAPS